MSDLESDNLVTAADDSQSSAPSPFGEVRGLPLFAMVLASGGEILQSSGAAERILRDHPEEHCVRIGGNRLLGYLGETSERFDASLRLALTGCQRNVLVRLWRDGRWSLWRVTLSPYADSVHGPARALFLLQPANGAWGLQPFARLFGLTATEARVLVLIGRGARPQQVASGLAIAVSTARSHLASIFEKTGARNQAQLVQLIAGCGGCE